MKGSDEKRRLSRFEIVLSLIAIVVAALSLILGSRQQQKMLLLEQAQQQRGQAPNIQLESCSAKIRVHKTQSTGIREFRLNAKVVLKNLGGSTASLVNVSWDPIDVFGLLPKRNAWLAVSDDEFEPQEEANWHRDFQKTRYWRWRTSSLRPASYARFGLLFKQRAQEVR